MIDSGQENWFKIILDLFFQKEKRGGVEGTWTSMYM